ncbi:MAG: metallophosphoesterase family protein [Thermomicrobiaceae bacterium]
MRIAIISDSHGNLTALDTVLADIDRTGPYDAVLMGGDVAYGGPFPAECIDRIAERGLPSVRGNTDQMILDAVAGSGDPHGEWVVNQLGEDHLRFLESVTVQYTVDTGHGTTLGLVHATPWSIYDSYLPDSTDVDFRRMLLEAGTSVLAYGHIHLQHHRALDSGHVIGVGSVGLPFDGDRRAMYTVVEAGAGGFNIDFRRLEYDFESAIRQAKSSGGPNGETFATNLANATRPG